MMELALDFISAIFIQIALFYFFGKLYQKKPIIKITYVISVIFVGMWQILMNLCGLNIVSTISTVIYIFIMYIKMYNCSIKESRNYSIVIWIIAMLVDIIVMCVMNSEVLVKIHFSNEKLAKGIASIIMSSMMMFIANLKIIKKVLITIIKKINKIEVSILQIIVVIIAFIIISFVGIQSMGDFKRVYYILIMSIIATIVIVSYIIMKYQIVTLKTTNEILEKNNEVNIKIITYYRMLKHNLENQLLGIKTVANKQSKELITNILKEYNQSFYMKYDINAMPSGINGLITEKLYNYKDIKMDICIDNRIKKNILKEIGPRSYNLLCEAIGLLLDNALEATLNSGKKIILLKFIENNYNIEITIMNTFAGSIDIDKIGTINYTTKEKGHGLGLYSLIGRKNITVTSQVKNNYFINKIIVKKKRTN